MASIGMKRKSAARPGYQPGGAQSAAVQASRGPAANPSEIVAPLRGTPANRCSSSLRNLRGFNEAHIALISIRLVMPDDAAVLPVDPVSCARLYAKAESASSCAKEVVSWLV